MAFFLEKLRRKSSAECSIEKLTPGSFSPLIVTHQKGMRGINEAFVFEA